MNAPPLSPAASRRRWSLRAMFVLTTVAAVYLAIARWMPLALFHFTAILTATTVLMLGRKRKGHPLAVALCGVVAGVLAGAISFPTLVTSEPIAFGPREIAAPWMGCILGAVYGCCCAGVFLLSTAARTFSQRGARRTTGKLPENN